MSTGSPCMHGNSPGSCLYCRADRGEIQVFSGPVFPCPQCARFREKVAGLEHFIREKGLYDYPGDAGIIAPKLIKYLTE